VLATLLPTERGRIVTLSDKAEHGKADFNHLYDRPDPRAYYRGLGELDYQIPHHAHPLFDAVRRAQQVAAGSPGSVLDVCCSYGINAALLACDLSLDDVYRHYADPALADLEPERLAEADRRFYAEHRLPDAPTVLGLDLAAEAIAYSREVGLLDDGWAQNLEESEPSQALVDGVRDVSLIMVTGGVGYVTEHTFGRLLRAVPEGRAPWVASFVLRVYPYDAIADTLSQHGLATERLTGATFPQRRFASTEEQDAALQQLHARGLDTRGLEDDGWYLCDFFLSRPHDNVERQPLDELLAAHRAH